MYLINENKKKYKLICKSKLKQTHKVRSLKHILDQKAVKLLREPKTIKTRIIIIFFHLCSFSFTIKAHPRNND